MSDFGKMVRIFEKMRAKMHSRGRNLQKISLGRFRKSSKNAPKFHKARILNN